MTLDLQARLTALERQNAVLKKWLMIEAVSLAAMAAMGQASPFSDVHAKHITAESLVITDGRDVAIALSVDKGRPRVLIGNDTKDAHPSSGLLLHAPRGVVELSLFDARDKTSMSLSSDGVTLRYDNKVRGGFVSMPSGARLMLSADDGKGGEALTLAATKGRGGMIDVKDQDGQSRYVFVGSAPRPDAP